jgi:chemotaxis protein MotB
MKKTLLILVSLSLSFSLLFTSCVSNKKFAASEAQISELQRDSINSQSQLYDCNEQVSKLKKEKAFLQDKNAAGEHDLKALSDESKLTIDAQADLLRDFQAIIQSQNDVMNKLKNSISEALMNYEADELSVYLEDGKVYVSLQEKLLFKSGSDVVDPKGKEALKILAQVLNETKNVSVIIEGHTDNIPIKTERFKDNWALSSARATSIVRILTENNGFDSNRITASGKGQFHPVQTNDTEKGRAANRRTEVILSPDLKEIYSLLN